MIELLLFALLAAIVFLLMREQATRSQIRELQSRLTNLENQHPTRQPQRSPVPEPTGTPQPTGSVEQLLQRPHPDTGKSPRPTIPPPLPPVIAVSEPNSPASKPKASPSDLPQPTRRPINWESFLGVKLFAWVGGLALFLGVAFFVKYSFEQGLVSPAMRVTIGMVSGIALIAGGLFMPRQRHLVTVQTLCATGILILYASLFASHSFYQFIDSTPTFLLMALVTGLAFYLSIHLNAQAVAVLGLVGGFLTPPLLSTGVDRPFALFSYIALLDLGLIAVALRQRWNHLAALAAGATILMQWAWMMRFFEPLKVHTGMGIFLGFSLLFLAVAFAAHRVRSVDKWICAAALALPASALLFASAILLRPYPELARQPVLFFGYVFLVDVGIIALAALRTEIRMAQLVAGGAVFSMLALWTLQYLNPELLNIALGCYLLFSLLHTLAPVALQKFKPAPAAPWWSQLFPPAALILTLIPIFELTELTLLLWPVVLLINLIAIVLAIATSSLLSILAAFVLTAIASALWIFRVPPELSQVPGMLAVVGGFAVFFMAAAAIAARHARTSNGITPKPFTQSLALGTTLPFLLITLMILRLPLDNPGKVFGLVALLAVLLLLLGRFTGIGLIAPATLAATLIPQFTWFLTHANPALATQTLAWTLGFAGLFFAYPFAFRTRFQKESLPWLGAALALPAHYFILHHTVKQGFPNDVMGLLPAILAIPCLLALLHLKRSTPTDNPIRNTQLALFGAATLFFITLIFPVQFDRQWVTLGWALEGIGLIWLYHRVPHPGLKLVGTVLLVVAFVRLGLNPEVIHYKTRLGPSILNWYLYTYSIVSACLIGGALLLAPPRNRIGKTNVPPLLFALGAVLAFMLLNIEIANVFSTGDRLSFRWSGNLAQDMTYSLGWAVFALILLGVGFKANNAATRYCGMGLLVITLLKLFLHDLWQLGGLYRIGSLIGLAVVLILVSFIYQRFLSSPNKSNNP